MGTLIVPSLDHRFGWSDVPVLAVIAGDLLVVAGFLLAADLPGYAAYRATIRYRLLPFIW